MKKSDIFLALEPLIKVFNELGIAYYIGGSIASSAYGLARSTLDIDLVSNLQLNQVDNLIEKLKLSYFIDEQMVKDAIKNKFIFNIVHLETMVKIDIFILKDGLYYQESFNRRRRDEIIAETESLTVYLCSPEDIILNKLDWYKSGNYISEHQWNDVLGVIKVQKNNLDMEYLTLWAKELGIYDLLKKALANT